MPLKPFKPCSKPGCPQLTRERFCERHKRQIDKAYDDKRGNSGERGYDFQWQKVRDVKAATDPLCQLCLKTGIVKALDVVHHMKPIETHPESRLDLDNLISLCTMHHEEMHKRWGRIGR